MTTETRQELQHKNSRAAVVAADGVLICDDEERLASLTAQLLESHGYRTSAATDVSSARKQLEKDSIGVLVLDVNLPGESSSELLDYLEQAGRTTRVLLTSGLSEDDVPGYLREHALVVGYIAKPYSVDAIAARLGELLPAA